MRKKLELESRARVVGWGTDEDGDRAAAGAKSLEKRLSVLLDDGIAWEDIRIFGPSHSGLFTIVWPCKKTKPQPNEEEP